MSAHQNVVKVKLEQQLLRRPDDNLLPDSRPQLKVRVFVP